MEEMLRQLWRALVINVHQLTNSLGLSFWNFTAMPRVKLCDALKPYKCGPEKSEGVGSEEFRQDPLKDK